MTDPISQPLDDNLFQNPNDDKLYVTETICEHWRQTSRWTYGIAFLGFLFMGLLAFGLIGLLATSVNMPGLMYLAFLILMIIVFAISRNMYRYSYRIKNAANYSDWDDMEKAFSNLNLSYGIYAVCVLLVCILLFVMMAYFIIRALPG